MKNLDRQDQDAFGNDPERVLQRVAGDHIDPGKVDKEIVDLLCGALQCGEMGEFIASIAAAIHELERDDELIEQADFHDDIDAGNWQSVAMYDAGHKPSDF